MKIYKIIFLTFIAISILSCVENNKKKNNHRFNQQHTNSILQGNWGNIEIYNFVEKFRNFDGVFVPEYFSISATIDTVDLIKEQLLYLEYEFDAVEFKGWQWDNINNVYYTHNNINNNIDSTKKYILKIQNDSTLNILEDNKTIATYRKSQHNCYNDWSYIIIGGKYKDEKGVIYSFNPDGSLTGWDSTHLNYQVDDQKGIPLKEKNNNTINNLIYLSNDTQVVMQYHFKITDNTIEFFDIVNIQENESGRFADIAITPYKILQKI